MPVRSADAQWKGSLQKGEGSMKLGSGAFEGAYSFRSRFEAGDGTNPEELVGAAHAGCFSMQLSALLAQAGHEPDSVHTEARVHLDKDNGGFKISKIELHTQGEVSGIDEDTFKEYANQAKEVCPVSKALAGTEITLEAALKS